MMSTIADYRERRVLLVGRGSRLLPGLAAELQSQGALVVLADQANPGDLPTPNCLTTITETIPMVRDAVERLGGLDVLVCHSGPGAVGAVFDVDARAWRTAVDALVGEAFELSQAAAKAMVGGGGVIAHVVGPDALHAYPNRSVAATGFAAIIGMIRALAVEFATHGIRVVGVIHGPLEGGPVGRLAETSGDGAARTLLRAPTGRLATATDIAAAVRFVAGPGASFMSGQAIRVDGGWASLNQAPLGMKFL
jgi:NAD(P)-dependent dehydrogenase (short-subunit alcohol dehydrogenase family)